MFDPNQKKQPEPGQEPVPDDDQDEDQETDVEYDEQGDWDSMFPDEDSKEGFDPDDFFDND